MEGSNQVSALQDYQRDMNPSTGTTVYRDDIVKTVTEICGWVDSSATVKGDIRCMAQVIWHPTSIPDTIILS